MTGPIPVTLACAAEPLTPETARQLAADAALTDAPIGPVGLELEAHLVDLDRPDRPVPWDRSSAALAALPRLDGLSAISCEPGGQVELSGPPAAAAPAIDRIRQDLQRVRLSLAEHRLGLACLGADPARPSVRTNPRPRYTAMAAHYRAVGRAAAPVMMCSTAAIQLNLSAGPRRAWPTRIRLAQALGPVLIAAGACSPWLAGRPTGWRSARRRAWAGLDDHGCSGLALGDDPAQAWSRYALAAPVLFTVTDDRVTPVLGTVPFGRWVSGEAALADRRPTAADLRTHLTTLFPPVRLRGWLEVRYLDCCPPRWWPAVIATAAVLLDDPGAADRAAELTEPVADLWAEAARNGLRDRRLAAAARGCLDLASRSAPDDLRPLIDDLAQHVADGLDPGAEVEQRLRAVGPTATMREYADV
jgi:glutamate--cysteine ligase